MAIPADYTALHRLRMARILDTPHRNARMKNLAVWNYVIAAEIANGTQFIEADKSLYAYLGLTYEICPMPASGRGGERIMSYLNQVYGLSQTDGVGKFIYSNLRDYALANGTRVPVRRFAAYNVEDPTVYLSTYDGRMWKIDGGTPSRVNNGEDDVFFLDDDDGVTCEASIGPHGILFDRLADLNFAPCGLGGITPEQQRMALIVWIFILAFPDLMPTKPLLIVEGTQGSGKSASVLMLQLALMGEGNPMILSKNKPDDFGVILLRSPIAVFDNTDSYIDWVPDSICAYVTSGSWTKRKLFSDADEVKIKPHAFIAVATKNPASFRREDTADRCLILRLERLDSFRPLDSIKREVFDLRPQLMGEYIWYVNQIVAHLRITNGDEVRGETFRMADFARFARAVGAVLHWSDNSVTEMLEAMRSEQLAFVNEEDPLVDVLHKWIIYRGRGVTNIGRKLSLSELFNELQTVALANQITMFDTVYKTPRALAQKIRSPHVTREFIVEMTATAGHKHYQLWRQSDARLESIPTDALRGG